MPELTKKRPTDAIELCFRGPAAKRDAAVTVLVSLGFVDISGSVDWRDAFPGVAEEDLPGLSFAGFRHREGLSQRQLAALTGIPHRHISEMETGKRPIGKKNAKVLAQALHVISYKLFL